jgi:hypothetical protein
MPYYYRHEVSEVVHSSNERGIDTKYYGTKKKLY